MSFAAQRLAPLAGRLSRAKLTSDTFRLSRRGYADHGEVKVAAWEAPTQIGKWKEEHIVFAVLGSWAVGIYTASTVFGGKKPTEGGQASSEQPTGAAGPAAPAPAQ